jgi:hypothetical protein
MKIVGWIRGRDGKKKEYWWEGTGRPAYFIPQNVLHAPGLLKEMLDGGTHAAINQVLCGLPTE